MAKRKHRGYTYGKRMARQRYTNRSKYFVSRGGIRL